MRTCGGVLQGFNGQAVVSTDQIVLATDVVTDPTDFGQLAPMTTLALANLAAAAITDPVETLAADAGYFSSDQLAVLDTAHQAGHGPQPLVPPTRDALADPARQRLRRYQKPRARQMRATLADPEQRARYRHRKITVEPVFGQLKNLFGDRFLLRGLDNVRAEFALMALAHNLRKLHAA